MTVMVRCSPTIDPDVVILITPQSSFELIA